MVISNQKAKSPREGGPLSVPHIRQRTEETHNESLIFLWRIGGRM
jgi:hypothetical protein